MILCYENNPKSENLTFSSLPCLSRSLKRPRRKGKTA